jgi:hypothetical protein
MTKEFIEGVHFTKEEINLNNQRYQLYLRNRNQSLAFPIGIFIGFSSVYALWRNPRFRYNHFAKVIYSINLFISTYIFSYEMWSKLYTNKDELVEIDNKLIEFGI